MNEPTDYTKYKYRGEAIGVEGWVYFAFKPTKDFRIEIFASVPKDRNFVGFAHQPWDGSKFGTITNVGPNPYYQPPTRIRRRVKKGKK